MAKYASDSDASTTPKPIYVNGVVTPVGRASFPHVHAPDTGQFGQNKYAITLLFEPDDPKLAALKDSILALAKEAFVAPGLCKIGEVKMPLRNGTKLAERNIKLASYSGKQVLTLKSKNAPRILYNRKDPKTGLWLSLPEGVTIYGGCYVRAACSLMSYQGTDRYKVRNAETGDIDEVVETSYGISALLEKVQFVKDGPSFGGGGPQAEDVFDELGDEATLGEESPFDA